MTNNDKIWIIADEVKRNLKLLKEMVGCHAITINWDGSIEFHSEKLNNIDGEIIISDRNSPEYPHEYFKTINGVKFYKVGK